MKKKLWLTLAVLMLTTALFTALAFEASAATEIATGTCGDNLTWKLYSDGELVIGGTGAMTDWTYPDYAPWYSYRSSIKTVTIESGVTTIGNSAFWYCRSLTSVTIPDSVSTIGYGAFDECSKLASINVDTNNAYYSSQNGILFNKDKTVLIQYPNGKSGAYTIPDSVTTIGNSAFYNCTALTSVEIPDSVTSIGNYAFSDCTALTSVTIGDSVMTIGGWAFANCSSLTSITIPDSVTYIGEAAFNWCTSLTSLTFLSPYTDITDGLYYGDLPKRTIYGYKGSSADHAAKRAGYTFSALPGKEYIAAGMCGATVTWEISSDGTLTISGEGKMDSYGHVSWRSHSSSIKTVIIGNSVTYICWEAFEDCSSLTSVTIGNSVTSIDDYTFSNCTSLKSVVIPDSVTYIGYGAFEDCSSLTSVTIGNGVTAIYNYAFRGCSALTSVTIPDSVTTIGEDAFSSCTSLTSVTIGNGVTSIGYSAFEDCSSLKSVVIPDSVTTIRGHAFSWCDSLTSVTIPDSVTTIGDDAFSWCDSLTSVTIGDSVTYIGEYAFYNCSSLTSVTIGDSVTSIGERAFYNCYALTSVTIPDSVTYIGEWAFAYCSSLTSVTIPDSVTSIGSSAFRDCSSLTSVTILSDDASFGSNVFSATHADFTIHSYAGSTAETYAREKGYSFVALEAEPEIEPFDITLANMTLGNELAMNFYFNQSYLDGTDYYAVITKYYADGRDPVEKTVPYSEFAPFKNGSTMLWKISFNGIAAKEMADLITVQVFNGDDQAVSTVKNDGIRDYIMRNLDKTTFSAKQKVWAVECLNYGAASQTNFNYNTADLANNQMTDAHKALGLTDVEMNNYRELGTNAQASNLSLESNISLSMYFKGITDPTTKYAIATFTDHNGNEKEARIEGSAFKKNGTLYGVPVDILVASDVRQLVTVTVYNVADETVYGTCVDSVEGYAARMSNGNDLYSAVIKFGQAAYNMFH